MISFEDISKLFSFDLEGKCCIEIEFSVVGEQKYQSCWMGKTPDKQNNQKEIYWYGLTPDGLEAYNYDNYEEFSTSPVFDGKSLKDVWNSIDIFSVDGCEPEERLTFYTQNY